jgi:hypothetical protein
MIPLGIDVPMILMADDASVDSLVNIGPDVLPFFWAVDVYYDPKKHSQYPAGYEGIFKVQSAAAVHDLYVPLASEYMTPVDIWKLTQPKKITGREMVATHDEL